MSGNSGGNQRLLSGRGVNPVLGIVLLFGMVVIGATLVFLAGAPLLDALESQNEREHVHNCMDEADHQLTTVAMSGSQQTLSSSDGSSCQVDVAGDEGQIELLWYNQTEDFGDIDDLPWDRSERTATADLGSLEFDLDDRTVAHQGGGVWETTDSGTQIVSEPGIGYDDDTLQFNIMQLDEDELTGSDPVARTDYDSTTELANEIERAAGNSDGDNVAIRIDSSYHDGWYQHLNNTFDTAGDDVEFNPDHKPDSGVVEATIEGVGDREITDDPLIFIEEDEGVGDGDHRVEYGSELDFTALLNTTYSGTGEPPDGLEHPEMSVSVIDKSIEQTNAEDGSLAGGGPMSKTIGIDSDNYAGVLEPGTTYEYMVSTPDDSLDTPGEFYLGKAGTHLNISDDIEMIPTGDDNTTIRAPVQNHGLEDVSEDDPESISLDFDHPNISSTEQDIAPEHGSESTVEWEINETQYLTKHRQLA